MRLKPVDRWRGLIEVKVDGTNMERQTLGRRAIDGELDKYMCVASF